VTAESPSPYSRAGRLALLPLLAALRPKQWTKNALLFVGVVFSLNLGNLSLVLLAAAGFMVFCAASSAGYLVNDLADLEADRRHPRKAKRPIAAGQVSPDVARALAVALAVGSVAAALALQPAFGLLTALYLALTLSYTFWIKHLVLLDVFGLAAGFVLRAVAGAVVVDVPISPWLYVCTGLGAVFIALGKRRHELQALAGRADGHRPILAEYSLELLDQLIAITSAATIIAYSLYTFSGEKLPRNGAMMLTIPVVLYGIFRYLYLVRVKGLGGSPEELLLKDRGLLLTVLVWAALSVAILYLGRS
jgi:4-hydroxybenzoate polyprenyltransferase